MLGNTNNDNEFLYINFSNEYLNQVDRFWDTLNGYRLMINNLKENYEKSFDQKLILKFIDTLTTHLDFLEVEMGNLIDSYKNELKINFDEVFKREAKKHFEAEYEAKQDEFNKILFDWKAEYDNNIRQLLKDEYGIDFQVDVIQ